MTSQSKKRKCHHSNLDRGGEKAEKFFRMKGIGMFHKKQRVLNKKLCIINENEEVQDE